VFRKVLTDILRVSADGEDMTHCHHGQRPTLKGHTQMKLDELLLL